MFHFVFSYISVYLCFQKRISVLLNFLGSEKRVDYAAAVEDSSSSSSSSLVMPEQSSGSVFICCSD
jgi:hypothetical protein